MPIPMKVASVLVLSRIVSVPDECPSCKWRTADNISATLVVPVEATEVAVTENGDDLAALAIISDNGPGDGGVPTSLSCAQCGQIFEQAAWTYATEDA